MATPIRPTKKSEVFVASPNCPNLNYGLIQMRRDRPGCEWIYFNKFIWLYPSTAMGSLGAKTVELKWEELEDDLTKA